MKPVYQNLNFRMVNQSLMKFFLYLLFKYDNWLGRQDNLLVVNQTRFKFKRKYGDSYQYVIKLKLLPFTMPKM